MSYLQALESRSNKRSTFMVAVTLIDGMSSDCRPVGNYFFFMVAVTLIDGMSSDCRPVVLLGGSLSWSRVASPCVSYEEEDT